jgi:hypothetical protein
VSYVDTEGAVLRRHTDFARNHEERRFVIDERYCGVQPEGPIHGNLFRGDTARPSGYPSGLDKSLNRSGQLSPDFDVTDVLRCPNCDALFERGRFDCYGAKKSVD